MGHNRLPTLPATRSWQDVVELLESSAPPVEAIAQSARAAQNSFVSAADDPVYVEAVRILIALTSVGVDTEVVNKLRRGGLTLPTEVGLFDLLDSVGHRLDEIDRSNRGSSDLGQLARRALLSTLHQHLLDRMPGLFSEQSGDMARALRQFSTPSGFSELSRGFFTRMTIETMTYWLERTLGARIQDSGERNAFDAALTQFSSEATRIIREFSAGWYAKNVFPADQVPEATSQAFAAVAFKKINDELRRKTGVDA